MFFLTICMTNLFSMKFWQQKNSSFLRSSDYKMVGATGFEPTTPWSQARCSTKLSYAPILTSSRTIILRHFIVVLMRNTSKLYIKLLLSKMVRLEGFEPPTHGLEGRCSIQLSYRREKKWSERQDSNLRPPGPKPGALPN